MLAYANFVAAQEALWKGYFTIAPCMIRNTRNLIKNNSFDFMISRSHLDYMLCESYSHFDQEEALNLIKQVIDSKTLTRDLATKATSLREKLVNKACSMDIKVRMQNFHANQVEFGDSNGIKPTLEIFGW
jgi:hypothetical protein